jgi:hypothetical protein
MAKGEVDRGEYFATTEFQSQKRLEAKFSSNADDTIYKKENSDVLPAAASGS